MLQTENFNGLISKLKRDAKQFEFNLKDLPDTFEYTPKLNPNAKSIRAHEKFKPMFEDLCTMRNSCLYWFEVKDECDNLIELLNNNRTSLIEKQRVVPVKNKNCDSNVLYVGIRRGGFTKKWKLSNISGRIIQHFGYYKVGSTQGLQLAHWSVDSGLDINLKIIQFEEGFPNAYLEAFEKIIAYKLRPLCGKH